MIAAAPARASGPGASCDAPFEGSALSTNAVAAPLGSWSGVATSRARAGVIAVWNAKRVAISRDDGRTFQRLNAKFTNIEDLVVGAGGTVFVLDGKRITMAFARGHIRHVPVPQTYSGPDPDADPENIRLAVGGGYLVFVSRAGLALSRDYGASWQLKEFPDSWADAAELDIKRDGTLDAKLTVYDCHSGDYDLFYRGPLQGPWLAVEGDLQWFGHTDGYRDAYEEDATRLYSVGAAGESHVIVEFPSRRTIWPADVLHNEQHDYGRFRNELYRLTKRKAELLTRDVPEELALVSVDGCDRLLGLYRQRIVRWSSSTGWRQLDVVIE
jgi:hypothetical protein